MAHFSHKMNGLLAEGPFLSCRGTAVHILHIHKQTNCKERKIITETLV